MGTEVSPMVDLRALSQSELLALAAASPHAVDPRGGRGRDLDLLPPPQIDRSVFNESAGSRKQTFSRHRVTTNVSHNLTPSTVTSSSTAAAAAAPTEEDSENLLIVFHLQQLFARDDPSYSTVPLIPPQQQTLTAPTLTAPTAAVAFPAPSLPLPLPPPLDPDREMMNPKGVPVDLARLAQLVDPYGEEIQKRTAGLGLESELLGYMNGLEGQWGSRRRRRKFVDAATFGDHLPHGWKLILGIKRKERAAWINCRRYVSPKGHQFATCKEVSSYFMSLLGYPEAKPDTLPSNNGEVRHLTAADSVGLHQQTDSNEEKQSAVPVSTEEKQSAEPVSTEDKQNGVPVSTENKQSEVPVSTDDKQSVVPVTSVTLPVHCSDSQRGRQNLYKGETRVEADGKECKKCNLTFEDQSAYVQHQLSFHQRKAKRRRVNKSVEVSVGKGGKFEQECQRTSEDKAGYLGYYDVADVRNQGQSPAKLYDQPSLAAVPYGLPEMTVVPEQEKDSSAGEPVSVHHDVLLKEITGLPQHRTEHSAGEPFSGGHKEHVDNSGDIKTHDGACHVAEESLSFDVASKPTTCNSAKVHVHASSKDLEFPSADCSQSFNRSDETCNLPQKVPPMTNTPSERKYMDDPMNCSDITESKQVSEHCDLLDRKFSNFPGETNFHDQVENNPLPTSLDEPDLNSISMDVDDSRITCNFDLVNSTSSVHEKPVEDPIDHGMTALKNAEISSDVRLRDVNLNSCLDTIPSPVSGANCETSNALDDGNRSSIIAQCFGASSNDDNVYQETRDERFVNQNNVCKAENFVNQNNDMVYQPNLTMNHMSPPQISVDYFNSCSLTSEIKNSGSRGDDSEKEQYVNSRNIPSDEAGFDSEAFNNDIFNGTITESSLAQLNNAMNMKTDFSNCYSLSDLNTLTGGTANDAIDFHGMRSSFVESTSRSEPNEHCTLDFDIKGSMLEALERSDSDLENQYNGGDPACDSLPAAGPSGTVDDFMSMHTNFGSLTSLVRAVEGGPMSRMIQDQCDLQLGFGGHKQQMYPSFEEHLRMASAGAPQFGSMDRHNPVHVPVPEPTLMLGYEPTLMLGYAPVPQFGSCPPVQLGWDPSKMVGVLQSVCVWCNTRFQHFGTAEQQADSVGYICPTCKDKTSGQLSILNNGSSL